MLKSNFLKIFSNGRNSIDKIRNRDIIFSKNKFNLSIVLKNYSQTSLRPNLRQSSENFQTHRKQFRPKTTNRDFYEKTSDDLTALNIFQYKNHKDLKKIYFTNQMFLFEGAQINKIVDILDFYVTLNQKNTIKSAEDILSQDSFCLELIKKIHKFTNDLDNKSILKILNLNCNLFTKNVVRNENLNKLAFSLTKDVNFDNFFKNLQKFRNVSDLFLHLNNMQNIIKSDRVGDYKINLNEHKNYFYFRINLFSKSISKYIELQKIPTLTLASLLWVYGKNGIKQHDVSDKLMKEISRRVKFLNIKNLITCLSVVERFNFFEYDKNIIKILIKRINSSKDELEKELKTSDVSYLISMIKFLTSYKIFTMNEMESSKQSEIDVEIFKIVNRSCVNYLNKEVSLEDYNLSLMLKYFFIFQKENYIQQVLDKIFDRFSNLIGSPVINIFSLFFYINFDKNSENQIFLLQFNQLFFELFQITDLDRFKLSYKEYLQIVFCLFQIDYYSTRVKDLTINNKIRNFITSLLNENFLNKITEDFYETFELLEILNMIRIHNKDLFDSMRENCQSELNFMLENKYDIEIRKVETQCAAENNTEECELDMIVIDDFEKKSLYSLQNIINIFLIVKSLNIKIENPQIEEKLLMNLKSQMEERHKLTLHQKIFYNYLVSNLEIESSESKNEVISEITKSDVENDFLKHNRLIEKCLSKIKEIKSSLYIETNFILDKKFLIDIYIPSLKKAFIININTGLIPNERHISFPHINKEHILYSHLTRHFKSIYDIELTIINEDLVCSQNKEKMKLFNSFWNGVLC